MAYPCRKQFDHAVPNHVCSEEAVFFITICCKPRGHNQLARPEPAKRLFDSVRFLHERGDWWIGCLLLMPDHLHAVAAFPTATTLTRVVTEWKKSIARTVGIQWQPDFFDHRLRQDESLREKEDSIWQNPVRAGLVKCQVDWPYVWQPPIQTGRARDSPALPGKSIRA